MQRTLCLIKPDAVSRNLGGKILTMIQEQDLLITALKMVHLNPQQAALFYAVHKERPFFESLVQYMCSGPIIAAVLEGEDAIARYRKLMGATNPVDAEEGSIRKRFAMSLEANSVHGSDTPENAEIEIACFFSMFEMVDYYA